LTWAFLLSHLGPPDQQRNPGVSAATTRENAFDSKGAKMSNPWMENWKEPLPEPPLRKTPKKNKIVQRTDGKKEQNK
jgi:hypothetical protein